ncbi:MAG: hypothetical protein NTZ35_02025 [Ignavibacteriales bacterium]|nr:hypothetical protein [Ignavibacteriales bacterium]
MKANPIQEFILKNKRNLQIAAAVAESWPDAREKLVSGFLDRLESRLAKKLKGWRFEREGIFFVDPWSNILLWKPAWEDQYYLGLHFANYGQKMKFGVVRSNDLIGKRKLCSELLAAVSGIFPSARQTKYFEAVIDMHSPAADWRKPEVLWRMHTDHTFLEEVSDQLLQVAKISAPILDRLVRKK